ncbi:MAG: hypothetical protein KAJ40_03205 [Alphaproteobacteria bacterium]|nr:hypothetical protein [Alphaproteobacteria bacterium]
MSDDYNGPIGDGPISGNHKDKNFEFSAAARARRKYNSGRDDSIGSHLPSSHWDPLKEAAVSQTKAGIQDIKGFMSRIIYIIGATAQGFNNILSYGIAGYDYEFPQ